LVVLPGERGIAAAAAEVVRADAGAVGDGREEEPRPPAERAVDGVGHAVAEVARHDVERGARPGAVVEGLPVHADVREPRNALAAIEEAALERLRVVEALAIATEVAGIALPGPPQHRADGKAEEHPLPPSDPFDEHGVGSRPPAITN
jgi:hypothetical protein